MDATLTVGLPGTGSLIKIGAGTLVLTADNIYTGPTNIAAGILQLGNAAARVRSSVT